MKVLISPASSPWRKLIAFIATAALVVLGLMFSALLFAVIAIAALIAWGYIWWKTRALRRQMREMADVKFNSEEFSAEAFRKENANGDVIEGEVIRKVVTRDAIEH